jgi:hypothetical protein
VRVESLHDAGGGALLMFFASLGRAVKLRTLVGAGFDWPIIPVAGLDGGTLIAVDAGAFASGFSAEPEIEIGKEATLHMSDTPAEIVSTAPATAAPVRSMFQTNSLALRMILPCAWAMRAPGLVQVVSGINQW